MLLLKFGSRSGSYFAFVLFATLFLVLAVGVMFEIRRRAGRMTPGTVAAVMLCLFLAPVGLVYASSLSGFYEAEVQADRLLLRYLLPFSVSTVSVGEVAEVEAAPAFRSVWRLHIMTTSGTRFESATSSRQSISQARDRLRALTPTPALHH